MYVAVWWLLFFYALLTSDHVGINCRIYLLHTVFLPLLECLKSVPYKFPVHSGRCISRVSWINRRKLGRPPGFGTELTIRNSYVSCLHLTSKEIHYLLFQISSSPTLVINIIYFLPSMLWTPGAEAGACHPVYMWTKRIHKSVVMLH